MSFLLNNIGLTFFSCARSHAHNLYAWVDSLPTGIMPLVAPEYYNNQLQFQNDSMLVKFLQTNIFMLIAISLILLIIIASFLLYRRKVKKQINSFVAEIDELKQVIPASITQPAVQQSNLRQSTNLQQTHRRQTKKRRKATSQDGDKFIKQIISAVNSTNNMNCNVETLAAQLSMSSQTLRRRIFEATGESPKVLITRLKMQRASDLLLNNPHMPITQIATQCGFTEASSFIRSFQNTFGMSPTQYRNTNNNTI